MKKYLLLILIAVIFLHGCACKEDDFNIPKEQQKLILEMSDDEIIKNLTDTIDQWLIQETEGEILDYEITFTSDYLRVDQNQGVKIFNPFSLNLDFRYDTIKHPQITEEMKENLSINLPITLGKTLVGSFTIYDLNITTSGEGGNFLSSERITLLPHKVDLLQSNEEKKALKLLKKNIKGSNHIVTQDGFSQALSNMIIDRFGIKKDSSQLIIEFTITDISSAMDTEKIKEGLSKTSDELFQAISRDKEITGFLEQEGIKQFRIYYFLPGLSYISIDNYEFTYDFTY